MNLHWNHIKADAYKLLTPSVKVLKKTGITPNMVTTIGFVFTIASAAILIFGGKLGERGDYRFIGWFGVITLVAGAFDMLDGHLARSTGKMTKFGAFYDSVLDRYSELVMFFGICYYLVSQDYFLSSLFAFVAMIGSIMVSYIRARAEGLNVECKVGLMQRPERILTIGFSAIAYGLVSHFAGEFKFVVEGMPFIYFENISIFTLPIFALSILTNYTAIQRLNHCYKKM